LVVVRRKGKGREAEPAELVIRLSSETRLNLQTFLLERRGL
jgi:hypothetical protein